MDVSRLPRAQAYGFYFKNLALRMTRIEFVKHTLSLEVSLGSKALTNI